MSRLTKKDISNIVSDELKNKYKTTTGIELTDNFLWALYKEHKAHYGLAKILKTDFDGSSIVKLINDRLNGMADNWHKSSFLHNIEKNNGYTLDGEQLNINPEIVSEYQHRCGVIIEDGTEMQKWLRQAIELSIKDEERDTIILTPKKKSMFINEYMMLKIRRYRIDEED